MNELSPDIRALLRDSVDSFDKLEVLLWLRGQAEPSWSAAHVATALRFPELAVEKALEGLAGSGLIRLSTDAGGRYYHFAPAREVADAVEQLAAVYQHRRLDILNYLSEHAIERLRDSAAHALADAFRIRGIGGGKKDG